MDRKIDKNYLQRNKKKIWIPLTVIALGISYSFYNNFSTRTLKVENDKVTIAVIEKKGFEEYINISGVIKPKKSIQIVALEGGIIEKINTEDGNIIEKDSPFLVLSNQSLKLDLINKQTALLDQLNNLRVSRMSIDQNYYRSFHNCLDIERELSKAERVLNANSIAKDWISGNEYKDSKEACTVLEKKQNISRKILLNDSSFRISQIEQLDFSMKLIEDNLLLVKSTLENLSVKTPITGQITNFNFELGQRIEKGEKICDIDLKKGFIIRAKIDENYISRIQEGLTGHFSFNGNTYTLKLKKIYPKVNTDGMFEVDLWIENEVPAELKLGQTAYIKLILGKEKTSLLLKKGPFYQATGGNWVFVINNNGIAQKRQIMLGNQNPNYYEITEGLNIGDRVIISDYTAFGNADEIKLLNK